LVGAVRPNSGYAKVLGLDPVKDKWKLCKQIGYMPQSPALYNDLSVRDNILFFGKAQDVPDLQRKWMKYFPLLNLHQERTML